MVFRALRAELTMFCSVLSRSMTFYRSDMGMVCDVCSVGSGAELL